jgi:hypothetical protein
MDNSYIVVYSLIFLFVAHNIYIFVDSSSNL